MTKDDFIAAVRECADLLGKPAVKEFAGGPITGVPEEARQPLLNVLRAKVHEAGWTKTEDDLWVRYDQDRQRFVLRKESGALIQFSRPAWEIRCKREARKPAKTLTFMHASGDPHMAVQVFIRRAADAGCEVRDTGRFLECTMEDGSLRRCAKPQPTELPYGAASGRKIEYTVHDEVGATTGRLADEPKPQMQRLPAAQPRTFQDFQEAMARCVEAVEKFKLVAGKANSPELIKQLTSGAITDDKLAPVWQRGKPGITPEVLAHNPDDTNAGLSQWLFEKRKYLEAPDVERHAELELENMVLPPPKATEKAEPAPRLHPLQRVAPLSPAPYAMTCWRNCDGT